MPEDEATRHQRLWAAVTEHQQLCTGLALIRAARELLNQAETAIMGNAEPVAVEVVRCQALALAAVEEAVLQNALEARGRITGP